ncbi:hypothetical protein C0Q70_08877 [Pomacea canaliculata]|uniref:Nuclear receptor domain-containing protein n=2 Tax=Pomacea canaliculata TaxID=400727 RepID=A0A2T7P863_POMCA|nr:vitamin D3 receptor-like isoform X2 [Pomacea canaliculata]XP_025094420.1 vitamin D3 receptor-like isoform X2 [Pomacea canaliculata]XP_025094421.1 vitamin D3 receptor-like isoform X2 [Pomacea canaliculata]PVD29622.1 hypothetical protein C0Q70_08877 [Pomacea canaliculata]
MEVDDGHTHVEDEYDDDNRELPHVPRQGSGWLTQTTEDVPTSSSCESFPGGAPGCEREGARRSCCVCGDKASAYNFGVLTCDTCKAFFRRNATRLEELKCVFNGNCVIDTVTRKFCSSCRLQKCFRLGMKPQLILNDERKKARLSRSNKQREQEQKSESRSQITLSQPLESICHFTQPQPSRYQHPALTPGPQPSQSVPVCVAYSENSMQEFTSVQSSPVSELCPIDLLPVFASEPCGSSHVDSAPVPQEMSASAHGKRFDDMAGTCHEACKSPSFQHVSLSDLPSDIKRYWLLSTEERTLLAHLTSKYQETMLRITHRDPDQPLEVITVLQMESYLKVLEKVCYHCVSFAKAVPEFRELKQVDQIAALKASFVQAYGICASSFFVPESDVWRIFLGDISVSQLPSDFHSTTFTRDGADLCTQVKAVAGNDLTLYALLHILVLLDPREGTINEPTELNTSRDKYLILLKHYLQSEYSYVYADRYFTALMNRLVLLYDMGQVAASHFKQFSHLFQPLLAEMLSGD